MLVMALFRPCAACLVTLRVRVELSGARHLTNDLLLQVVRNVQNILQTNCSVASSLGPPFLSQMSLVYVDMLSVYKCDLSRPPFSHSAMYVCFPVISACICTTLNFGLHALEVHRLIRCRPICVQVYLQDVQRADLSHDCQRRPTRRQDQRCQAHAQREEGVLRCLTIS